MIVFRHPVPGQEFMDLVDFAILDAAEDIGETGFWIEVTKLGSLDDGHGVSRVSPPESEPANMKFLCPITTGLMARSAGLLSMATRPSSRNSVKDGQRLSP